MAKAEMIEMAILPTAIRTAMTRLFSITRQIGMDCVEAAPSSSTLR